MDSAMLRVLHVHRNLATAACGDWSQWMLSHLVTGSAAHSAAVWCAQCAVQYQLLSALRRVWWKHFRWSSTDGDLLGELLLGRGGAAHLVTAEAGLHVGGVASAGAGAEQEEGGQQHPGL